jgi:hypothetical protein
MKPYWMHGYRCHGLWVGENDRVAGVSIGPRGYSTASEDGYDWAVYTTPSNAKVYAEGNCRTLKAAKRQAEASYKRLKEEKAT